MEDVGIKALVIGVAVFIAIMTVSVLMVYYSTARNVALGFGSGGDYVGNYIQEIDEALKKSTVSGIEAKNIISYFIDNTSVRVDLVNLKVPSTNGLKTVEDINNKLSKEASIKELYNLIRPASSFSLVETNGAVGKDQYILTFIK